MAKAYYLPRDDDGKSTWLQNFAAKLPVFTHKYGIATEELADVQTGASVFPGTLQYKAQLDAHQKAFVEFKDLVRDGAKGMNTITMPTMPTPMFGVSIVPGIFSRCAALVARIKAHRDYNVADGKELGIEGGEITLDYSTLKPSISIRLGNGGHPEIVWKKGNLDGIEIHKEDANGNLQLLAVDNSPNFMDMTPLPPKGTSEVWTYRVIYLRKDQRVGQWSDVVSITVTG